MYLKSLEISGFKSFAKKTNLDFKTPITAIVGPNGSGKSNVAETFRFVLGEQSLKSMRGKRGEDLIWNGGSAINGGGAPRSNRASAKITFDNSKRILNLDFDEVSIERVVYRDSLSEYFINGTLVRLKDIIELLALAHIGSSGHHIISQGEADHILVANPKERREMIEDALGLKIYQYKKRESERKLEKTEENINQVESLRREIAPHLRFLKKQVEKIEKTNQQKEDLKGLYREYLRREAIYLDLETKKLSAEKRTPEERLEIIEKELAAVRKAVAESPILDGKRQELLEVERKLSETREKREILTREAGRLEGEINSLNRLISKAKKDLEKQDNAPVPFSEVEKMAKVVETELLTAEGADDLGTIRAIVGKIKSLVKDFLNKIRGSNSSELKSYENELAELLSKKSENDEKTAKSVKDESEFYNLYETVKNAIEKEKDKSREAEKEMFRLVAEQKETYALLSLVKDRESKLLVEKDNFEREIREGAGLLGREVIDYAKLESKGEQGEITVDLVQNEPRHEQENRLREIQKIKIRIEDAGTGASEDVLKEFGDVSERDAFLAKELADLEQSSISLKKLIEDLNLRLENEFKTGVDKINSQFQDFFALMFGGGKASIKVIEEKKTAKRERDENGEEIILDIEPEDEKTELGIDIDVKLPRKNIRGLEMLSGGERALTSIALLFAVSQVNPPPFIILDETDAALDEANSKKYGDMIENLSKLSQLILITHNRETMSRAGVLYGVTMGQDGVSKLLSIEFDEAVVVAK